MSKLKLFSSLLLMGILLVSCAQPTPIPAPSPAPATSAAVTQVPSASTNPAPTATPSTPANTTPVELTFLWYNSGQEEAALQSLLSRFETENPGIKVNLQTVPLADLNTTIQNAYVENKTPDLARLPEITTFSSLMLDLRPTLKDAAGWPKAWPSALLPGDDAGAIYGFPDSLTLTTLYVNQGLFQKAGIALPAEGTTWDEWLAAARQVAAKTEVKTLLAIDAAPGALWGMALTNGAELQDPQSGKLAATDSSGLRRTLTLLKTLIQNNELSPLTRSTEENQAEFAAGRTLLYLASSNLATTLESQVKGSFSWNVVPMPCGEGGCTGVATSTFIAAFKTSLHPAETTRLIEFLSSSAAQEAFLPASLRLPARLDLAEKGLAYPASYPALPLLLKQITRTLPAAFTYQSSVDNASFEAELLMRADQLANGELTLDAAILKLQEKAAELNARK
ncbi:MAG TPA: extracellular solute-binding protein [Anaerolineaceae bacterium]|nr:extracellular solute-binding protein [Anaerolineaceae bacterium]HPN50217.1 extracellular solute-binding protein [Anaerolineaceae bacterium]